MYRVVGHTPSTAMHRKIAKANSHALLVDVEPLPYKDAAVKTDIAPNYDVHSMRCLLMILLLSHILKTTQECEKFLGVI